MSRIIDRNIPLLTELRAAVERYVNFDYSKLPHRHAEYGECGCALFVGRVTDIIPLVYMMNEAANKLGLDMEEAQWLFNNDAVEYIDGGKAECLRRFDLAIAEEDLYNVINTAKGQPR